VTSPTVDLSTLPAVGREDVLDELMLALEAASRGEGRTIFLSGEEGTGKTHFTRCVQAEAERREFRVAAGRAYRAEAGVPYSLFSDAFLPLLRSLPTETLTVLTRGGIPELKYLFPALDPGDGAPSSSPVENPAEFRTRVLWTFSELVRELSVRTPLLVVLEDIHWGDSSSLELVHFLARQITDHPVCFLLTVDELQLEDPQELTETERSLLSQGMARQLNLPPFTREETGILIRRAFGVEEEAAGDFVDRLHEWTQGNPFFIEETLGALIESERLYQKGSAWLGWEVREFRLPGTIRETVQARLSKLPPDARTVADLAAILGARVPFSLLGAVSPLSEEDLLATLDALVAHGVLSESLEEEGVIYDFRRTLVRETLLAEMGIARARILHGRVAEILEEYFGPEAQTMAGILAYHFSRAEPGRLGPKAALYLALAGAGAMERFGNREAAKYLRASVARFDRLGEEQRAELDLPGGRMEVLRNLARALTRLGEYDAALPAWADALDEARARGERKAEGEIRRRIGVILAAQGELVRALSEFQEGLDAISGISSPSLETRIRLRRGICLEELGQAEEAQSEMQAALALAESQQKPALLAQAHRALVLFHIWTGHPDRVRAHGEHALELSQASEARGVEFWTYWGLAVQEGLLGNTEKMAELVQEADAVSRAIRSPLLRLWTAELSVELAAATGDWDAGIAIGEQAIALGRALSQKTLLPRLLVWTALIYLGRGQWELANPLIEEAWQVSGAEGDGLRNIHAVIPAYIGKGYLAMAMEDYEGAVRYGLRGLELAEEGGYRLWALHRLLPLVGESYLWLRELEKAKAIGDRLREYSAPIGHRLGVAWADACDALGTWLKGDPERGALEMQRAATALEEVPMVYDAARLRHQLAGRLAEIGDREGAIRELNQIHETFLRLGAAVLLEKVRVLYRELGARPPRRTAVGEGLLTSRESEIARLVSERKSNKAIGKTLGISPRTVSTHLSNIYQKLDLGSRGELADYIRTEGVPGVTN
jgi:DNA-binding CsgD family transcriptional regulator